jgi:hypothetical protein
LELKRAISRLIFAAREKASEARRAAVAAIREELAIWRTENAGMIENAKKKALRVKTEMAFLAAGGVRAISRGNGFQDFFRGSA